MEIFKTKIKTANDLMNDLRQTKQYAQYLKSIGWIVEKIKADYCFIRKIPLTPFSIIKLQRPSKIDFGKINQLAKKYRSLVIYLEPKKQLSINNYQLTINHGFRVSRSPFLPTKTIQLDLTKSEKEIFSRMSKDARYGIRKAQKADITILRYNDIKKIEKFHQTWKRSASWNRYVPSLKSPAALKKSFGNNALFLSASHYNDTYHHSVIIAGTIILIANQTAYYHYAFTSKEGRQKSAQYLLVWEAIKLAKKRGCRIFDFEGIYDERFPIKSWKGFSHFKKSFGGKEIQYPGCFTKNRISLAPFFTKQSEVTKATPDTRSGFKVT